MTNEEKEVVAALREYIQRIEEIDNAIPEGKSISADEKKRLQALYTALKADIKMAVKTGKANAKSLRQTDTESCFFEPAMRDCSAELTANTNSDPIKANWKSVLWNALDQITPYLSQLEKLDQPIEQLPV